MKRSKNRGLIKAIRRLAENIFGIGVVVAILGLGILLAIKLFQLPFNSSFSSTTIPNCVVKGNISFDAGRKLYHIPGMKDYDGTIITSEKGEKWFCSESEAIAAGWQKAPR